MKYLLVGFVIVCAIVLFPFIVPPSRTREVDVVNNPDNRFDWEGDGL